MSHCCLDSTGCEVVYDAETAEGLAPGSGTDLNVSWRRYGEMVFLVEVDPDDAVGEASETAQLQVEVRGADEIADLLTVIHTLI